MNHFDFLQDATNNLNETNNLPYKTQNEVEVLKKEVRMLRKVIKSILNTLPEDQQQKAFEYFKSLSE